MKRCSRSVVIRKIQIKTKMRYYFTPTGMAGGREGRVGWWGEEGREEGREGGKRGGKEGGEKGGRREGERKEGRREEGREGGRKEGRLGVGKEVRKK